MPSSTRTTRSNPPSPATPTTKPIAGTPVTIESAFAPSQILTRTPPQPTTGPPPPPAPSKAKTRKTNSTTTPNASPNEATDFNMADGLRDIREMVASMKVQGANVASRADILAAMDKVIAKNDELEQRYLQLQEENSSKTRFENEIKEIVKEAVQRGTKPKTWAQIVSSQPSRADLHIEKAKQERLQKIKNEKAKIELTLSLSSASASFQQQVTSMKEQDIAEILQEAITHDWKGEPKIQIRAVKKVPPHMIKIQCNTEADVAALQQIKWERFFEGATQVKASFGIVLHGVPKKNLDLIDQPQAIRELEGTNALKSISRVAPLMRKPRNPTAPTHSIVIFLSNAEEADGCISEGVVIQTRTHQAVRYTPQCQTTQCFRCQGYGHKAATCTRTIKCGKCSKDHETRSCSTETLQCANCNGPHAAWHPDCPRKIKERERLTLRQVTIPENFLC